jgi:RNA polymerase sigma-70 factor (ECF subfamily)
MKTVDFTQHLLSIQTELFRFAFKLTADREEANDLLQETSLKALDNEEKFTPDTNFKGWMYTIMRNIFINNYRKTVRDQTFVDQTDNLFHLNLPQDSGFDSTIANKSCLDHIVDEVLEAYIDIDYEEKLKAYNTYWYALRN